MVVTVYSRRLEEHLRSAQSLLQNKDYVQAGEKVWGALTALVNSRYTLETHEIQVKESRFRGLVNSYERTDPSFRKKMRELGFMNVDDMFNSIFGLHKYFYGGTNYNPASVSKNIEFFIQLIKKLSLLPER